MPDQFSDEEPLDEEPAAPDKDAEDLSAAAANEAQARDEQLLQDMGTGPADERTPDQRLADDEKIMGELAGVMEPPRPPDTADAAADVPPKPPTKSQPEKKRGRYYVPPKERTPENRQERREEAARQKNSKAAESGTLAGFLEQGGEVPKSHAADASASLPEAFYRLGEASSKAIIDLIRRVDQLTEAMERMRL